MDPETPSLPPVLELSQAEIQHAWEVLRTHSQPPASCIRVQMDAAARWAMLLELSRYWHSLGVQSLYLSPITQAQEGSSHGYDVTASDQLRRGLGTPSEWRALVQMWQSHGGGLLCDIVPNHMAISSQNRWWVSVVEWGEISPHADWFDIDWSSAPSPWGHQMFVPFLPEDGARLEVWAAHLAWSWKGGRFWLRVGEYRQPLAVRSYPTLLHTLTDGCQHRLRKEARHELERLRQAYETMAVHASHGEYRSSWNDLVRQMAQLGKQWPELAQLFEELPQRLTPLSLRALLQKQHIQLCSPEQAPTRINYRRFFDITGLVGMRQENKELFLASHRLWFEGIRAGHIQGLRIDHPDGLRFPERYLLDLQVYAIASLTIEEADLVGRLAQMSASTYERIVATVRRLGPPLYVVVEKILGPKEWLPSSWPVAGTVGYEFLNALTRLFLPPGQEPVWDRLYANYLQHYGIQPNTLYEDKARYLQKYYQPELQRLARRLHPQCRDLKLSIPDLAEALAALLQVFPVYRTYGEPGRPWTAQELHHIGIALHELTSVHPYLTEAQRNAMERLLHGSMADLSPCLDFQQVSPAVAAKGLEDTHCYVFNRLLALNEVGGDPQEWNEPAEAWHQHNALAREVMPGRLLSTQTHDTKRGEDFRMRLVALASLPDLFQAFLQKMDGLCRAFAGGKHPLHPNHIYFFAQTCAAWWPYGSLSPEERQSRIKRLQAYMVKAMRESKIETDWIHPNPLYEEAWMHCIAYLCSGTAGTELERIGQELAQATTRIGRLCSLSSWCLKCAAPGVLDLYQGAELWDESLVDPDNRRAVDWALRNEQLASGLPRFDPLRLEEDRLGVTKMLLVRQGLHLRQRHPDLLLYGDYIPLEIAGLSGKQLIAFCRRAPGIDLLCCALKEPQQLVASGATYQPEYWEGASLHGEALLGAGHWVSLDAADVPIEATPTLPVRQLLEQHPYGLWIRVTET